MPDGATLNVEKDEAARLVSGNRGVDRMAGIFGTPIGRGTGGFDPVARGANWFFWIAGLSLVNSVLWLLGTNTFMVMGLASSMVATGFFLGIGRGLAGTGSAISIALGVLGALLISSIFAGLGLAARKSMGWASQVHSRSSRRCGSTGGGGRCTCRLADGATGPGSDRGPARRRGRLHVNATGRAATGHGAARV